MPSDDDIALVDRRRLRWDPNNPATLLGEGSFGVVHSGRFNGTPVAIKVVKRPPPAENASEDDKQREHAALKQHRREIHRFKVVQNPYIIQYLGVFRGEHPRDLYIVTEFLEGGSLHDSLSKMRARKAILDDRSFLQIATHIARGLNHVHASQYTHGDMKPQNILLTSGFQFDEDENGNIVASIPASAKVKIADFGLSKRLDGAESAGLFGSTTATTDFGTGPCGTYLYMSPEAYEGVSKLSDSEAKAADVYAFGLVLFELLSGLQSWGLERVKNPMQLSAFVRGGKRPAWGPREPHIEPEYIHLVSRCWSEKPEERPTVDDIVLVLEEQQEAFDRKVAEMVKCPSSQAFSDVTKHDMLSPECEDQKAGERRIQVQPEKLLSNHEGGHHAGDALDPEEQDNETKQLPNILCEEVECERIDDNVIAEDDAHTVEDGEDIFSSNESGPPSIRPVISVRLTHTEVAMYRSKQSQDSDVKENSVSDSEASESYSSSSREEEEDSDEENEDDEGAVLNAVSDMHEVNGLDVLQSQENADNRFMDSIAGPHRVQQVKSFEIHAPDVQPLALPRHERPVLGMGSVAGQNGVMGVDSRRDSALLRSFMAAQLATMGTEADRHAAQQALMDSHGQNCDQVIGDFDSISKPLQSLNLGPDQAPPLPPAPTEPTEQGKENVSAVVSNPKTPEETDAAKAAMQQRKAKMYSSPNVEDVEFNSLDLDFPSPGFAPPPGESKLQEAWSLSQPPLRNGQNGRPRPAHPTNVVPGSGPMVQAFQRASGSHNVDYSSTNVSATHGYSHHPDPYGSLTSQGASAPPLSETSQSAMAGAAVQGQHHVPNKIASPPWAAPGSNHKLHDSANGIPVVNPNPSLSNCAHVVDNSAVGAALQRHDAAVVLREWWNRGYSQAVAAGLAQAQTIGGEELLDLVREFTVRNNQNIPERKDPLVAKDLCAAIGHIARNPAKSLGPIAITRAVRAVLSVLPSFQSMNRQRNEVYSFANFALCNLFKVYNVIQEYELRMMVASWIAYSLSWNVTQQDHGQFDEVLAYTATSAARNFMWMNEQNVIAFVSCNRDKPYRSPSAPMTLIASMKSFDWTERLSVVEASLSAMAMIIHFPRQRAEFMKARGAEAVIEVLHKHAANGEITSLAFWMVTVLFSGTSGPPGIHAREEVETLTRAFTEQGGCQKFVAALERVGQYARSEKQKVESLEKGFNALLTVARFGIPLRAQLIDAGCMPMILNAVRQLALSPAAQYSNEDDALVKARGRLGVVLCELISEVSNEHKGMSYMRDNNVRHPLQNMMQIHQADDGFTSCCRVALTRLAY